MKDMMNNPQFKEMFGKNGFASDAKDAKQNPDGTVDAEVV